MISSDDEEGECDTVCIDALGAPSQRFNVHRPPSDIDTCVGFSMLRCVLSAISLLLALTDVPRTGLGLSSLEDYFTVIGLDTVVYFGPFAYPVAHIYKDSFTTTSGESEDKVYKAAAGGASTDTVDLWSYKFDSLSIPTRALAEHLNVSAYPPCVLYREPCTQSVLSLRSTFVMLDELIAAFTARYIASTSPPTKQSLAAVPLKIVTKSRWIDRLHHFIVNPLWNQTEHRWHTVQYFSASSHQLNSNICDPVAPDSIQRLAARPLICDLPVVWSCDHPELGSAAQVPIWEHIALRVSALKKQYPGLEIDLTLISSRMVLRSREWVAIPSVSFVTDTLEISTLIRGRNCSSPVDSDCHTVFVDDYRYERATFISDAKQWWFFAAMLRAMGQIFVWARFTLLWVGCYCARAAEEKFGSESWRAKLYFTWLTIAKIPSHMVIYGSWFPICCYALAHYIDCALIHLISNTVWSTINGVVKFEPIKYARIASIQMRNIWLVALILRLVMLGYQHCFKSRQVQRNTHDGVVGIRAILFGLISSLTVFSCLRARRFRDCSVIEVQILSEQIPLRGSIAFGLGNATEFGFRFDIKTLTLAVCAVLILIPLTQLTVSLLTGDPCIALTCRSYYVPHSADTIWSGGSLLVYWRMWLSGTPSEPRQQLHNYALITLFSNRVLPVVPSAILATQKRTAENCQVCRLHQKCKKRKYRGYQWQAIQGCPYHDTLADVIARRKQHWSAVRLMNLTMMTDPLVLVRLYIAGRQMFIYRVRSPDWRTIEPSDLAESTGEDESARHASALRCFQNPSATGPGKLYLFPYRIHEGRRTTEWVSNDDEGDEIGLGSGSYELVGSTNSSLLPWTVLLDCG